VPEHAELHLLLSMMTPLGWLERVPTYKDQQEKLENKDLSTYGFLGYPLLQSADILIYRADKVPVGEDQVPHIEFSRELARRFNHLYGREAGFEDKAREAVKKLGSKRARSYTKRCARLISRRASRRPSSVRTRCSTRSRAVARRPRAALPAISKAPAKRSSSSPAALLTEASRMPGLDGQKMSKSYGNTITLREDAAAVTHKVRRMPTDPARDAPHDPGDPDKCPVWQLHQVYSDEACQAWVQQGCRSAAIGCLDCKQPVIDGILHEQAPMRERAQPYLDDPRLVREIIADGNARARHLAAKRCATCARRWDWTTAEAAALTP
jgi:tryptophanyl-tRNA synthetase